MSCAELGELVAGARKLRSEEGVLGARMTGQVLSDR